MTHSNSPSRDVTLVTFTENSLAYAIGNVSCYGDLAPELIAKEVFRQLSQVIDQSVNIPSATIWLSRLGTYASKLEAVRNGDQLIAPAEIAWGVWI
ncbi:hypothetical protein [Pseudomonas cremoricolorata]|uniref:hypothetical protein n=1 Tax=Pseudomonas cremoricolorata TaxID=157783 RepID=UPI0012B622B4|nr:hypothetical protein [Pseudomonas cremoricolorata]